jgi:hypothetical protein
MMPIMPEPVTRSPIPKRDRKKMVDHFEDEGTEAIRYMVNSGAMVGGESVLALAKEWLREKELEQERRERKMLGYAKWAWDAALAAVVLAAIGIVLTLGIWLAG